MLISLTNNLKTFTSFSLDFIKILTESLQKHSLSHKTAIVANCSRDTRHWQIQHRHFNFWQYVIYYHVTYLSQSESTLYSCLNFKEPVTWNRSDIWSLSNNNRIRIHNHLVHKWTLKHSAKLAKFGQIQFE